MSSVAGVVAHAVEAAAEVVVAEEPVAVVDVAAVAVEEADSAAEVTPVSEAEVRACQGNLIRTRSMRQMPPTRRGMTR